MWQLLLNEITYFIIAGRHCYAFKMEDDFGCWNKRELYLDWELKQTLPHHTLSQC